MLLVGVTPLQSGLNHGFGRHGRIAKMCAPIALCPMPAIHITDIESAINFWRQREPSPDGVRLPAPTRALAEVYGLMVYYRFTEVDEVSMPRPAKEAWLTWYHSTPDTPCIAICSTSQGDAQCKGCGRSFEEVQRWQEFSPAQKRSTWRRITLEASAWRFNKYAERAAERKTQD